jgi:hypothetical protein
MNKKVEVGGRDEQQKKNRNLNINGTEPQENNNFPIHFKVGDEHKRGKQRCGRGSGGKWGGGGGGGGKD